MLWTGAERHHQNRPAGQGWPSDLRAGGASEGKSVNTLRELTVQGPFGGTVPATYSLAGLVVKASALSAAEKAIF